MKKVIYIVLFSLAFGISQAQEKMFECDQLRDFKLSPCGYFMCLVAHEKYADAYGLMMRDILDPCTEKNMLLAKTKVLAANRQYEKAQAVLTELIDTYPHDASLLAEQRRQDYLRMLDAHPPPLEMTPYNMQQSGNQMIAWADSTKPVILTEHAQVSSYFPRKETGEFSYAFLEIALLQMEEASNGFAMAIQKQGYAQIGPGINYRDSLFLFTAAEQKPFEAPGKEARLHIYEWNPKSNLKKPKPTSFSIDGADDGFPAYLPEENAVIFSSSRTGGKGGMDLYKSIFINGEWGEPIHLGDVVNTPGHELYPEVLGDTLFFTSNRKDLGYGGMDIYGYCFSKDSLWNLGYPVNTYSNDFRIVFASRLNAFMVSDRPGINQGDKIFKLKYEDPQQYFKGIVAKADWPKGAIGKKVTLINVETGAQLSSVIESDGKVPFINVKGESDYELAVDGMVLPEGFELNLYNQDGKLLKEMRSNTDGKYRFVLLTPMEYLLDRLDVEDESILQVDILGTVNAGSVPDEGFQIVLLDSAGNTIGTTYTTDEGAFAFRAVSPSDSYIIKSEVLDANSTIHIVDAEGNVISTITPNDVNEYVYIRLGADDRIITLTNELKQKVRISDKDQFDIGSIYFELNAYEIDDQATASLQKLITILTDNPHVNVDLSGHTDSRGSAAYNLKLSQYRIEAVIRFLESNGLAAHRITGQGYGEGQLKNKCADGVICTEEQHAENRRTEFRIYEADNNQ